MSRGQLFDYFLISTLAFVLFEIFHLLSPFAGSILAAILIGLSFASFHHWIKKYFAKHTASLQSLITTSLILLFLILPFVGLLWALVEEADHLAPLLKEWRITAESFGKGQGLQANPVFIGLRHWAAAHLGVRPLFFEEHITRPLQQALERFSDVGPVIAGHMVLFLFHLGIMAVALFFIFRDGETLYRKTENYLPLDADCKIQLREKVILTTQSILRGWFLTAFVQGLAASIGYFAVGLHGVVLLGFLTALTGLLPAVGTALVWVPVSIALWIHGRTEAAVFMLAWGTITISLIDAFLRPYWMGHKTQIPFIYLFFALLGGVEIWGFKGIWVGPILVGIAPILLDVYRHRFLAYHAERRVLARQLEAV